MRGKVREFPRYFPPSSSSTLANRADYRRMSKSNDDLMLDGNWSELPEDLIGLIIDELKKNIFFLLDYIRFGAVCAEWRSYSIQNYEHIKLPGNLPVLLIPILSHEDYSDDEDEHDNDYDDNNHGGEDEDEQEILQDDFDGDEDEYEEEEEEEEAEMPYNNFYYDDGDEDDGRDPPHQYYTRKAIWKGQDETRHKSTRSFYSLFERKVYQDFQLPVPYYKNCRGSSHGWLITVDDDEHHQSDGTTYSYPVRLLNPFRSFNNEIELPPLTTIPVVDRMNDEPGNSFYLIRAFLPVNPSSLSNPAAGLIVFGVYGGFDFGFCRSGDTAWTDVPLEDQCRPIEDLICYKGRFLAIIQNGSVLELDFAHPLPVPSVKFVARTPANADNATQKYLVESAGDLLQIHRDRDNVHKDGEDNCSTIGFRVFKLNAAAAAANDDEWVEMDNSLDGRMLFLGDNNSISLSAADFPGCPPDCIYFTDDNLDYYDIHPGPSDFGIFNFVDKSFARFYPMHNNTSMPPPIWIHPML